MINHYSKSPHGGDLELLISGSGLPYHRLIEASANINPLGPPDWIDAAFIEGRKAVVHYPDIFYRKLVSLAASHLGLDESCLVFGNGADELMFALARVIKGCAIAGKPKKTAVIEAPSYASYKDASIAAGFDVLTVQAPMPEIIGKEHQAQHLDSMQKVLANVAEGSVLWIGAPNNPTGIMPHNYPHSILDLANQFSSIYFVCDEAFIDFVEQDCSYDYSKLPNNIIIIRSMTKFWAVPGLRIGYLIANPELAKKIRAALPNWPVNSVADAFARRAFSGNAYVDRKKLTLDVVAKERKHLMEALSGLDEIEVFNTKTNYYLIKSLKKSGKIIAEQLIKKGISIRLCDNFENLGADFIRIAIRTRPENEAIISAISDIVSDKRPSSAKPKKRAKALMIQGCSSGAGKSLVAAAFCRIFRDEGIDVAPYKAQNMSLNSAITKDSLEIGRAQAVQAYACGLEADVRMNPVLLKPESNVGSQVILMGKPFTRCHAREYYTMHEKMRDTARMAYDSLASEHELIVLEGAGSPAEINLKKHDFVNMGAARYANARVILVGDIDKGGVFASFIGHTATFLPDELAMLSGFLINKFRGDMSLLGDAFAMTEARTGFKVLGCLPMIQNLAIPDEDEAIVKNNTYGKADINIAVPRLTRVSNFTDMDAFAFEPDVKITKVFSDKDFESGNFDAVIIPGTKSTVSDLEWLRNTGLAEAIKQFALRGGTVVGICGGYQMLGMHIIDDYGVESAQSKTEGLGLLPLVTTFSKDKTLSKSKALWQQTGVLNYELDGYEIHHGMTNLAQEQAGNKDMSIVVTNEKGQNIGYGKSRVWGSYLHGVFDTDIFRRAFINGLRQKRNLAELAVNPSTSLDAEINRLAEALKSQVDMDFIKKELGL